jgi:chromosomal replication initiation ATPase DnaA
VTAQEEARAQVYSRPVLPAPDVAAGDMVDYDALQATFAKMPFMVFDNNRAALEILQRDVTSHFPEQLPQKSRPYVFVGGVGVGKTSIVEHTVHGLEQRRRRAVAAFQERDSGNALALAREVAGDANTEAELWQRAYALATSRICYEAAQRIKDDYKEIGELAHLGKKDLLDARAKKFHGRHRNLDLWVIDDLQLLALGNPGKTLEWVFGKLNEMYERRKPVLVTSDKSPALFDNFPEHTRSRLTENICNVVLPTAEDKRAYAQVRFDAFRQEGRDFGRYEKDWLPVIVAVAGHYRHINAIFNNIANNGNGQKCLFTDAQLFEQALEMIQKEKKEANGAYAAYRVLTTVASLVGRTEKDLKASEAEMRRYKLRDEFIAKRTALVLAASLSDMPREELGRLFGYNGTPKQCANTVEGIIAECGKPYVDATAPVESQFHRVYQVVEENLNRSKHPLFAVKK